MIHPEAAVSLEIILDSKVTNKKYTYCENHSTQLSMRKNPAQFGVKLARNKGARPYHIPHVKIKITLGIGFGKQVIFLGQFTEKVSASFEEELH